MSGRCSPAQLGAVLTPQACSHSRAPASSHKNKPLQDLLMGMCPASAKTETEKKQPKVEVYLT